MPELQEKVIFVTGAGGFIGSAVVAALLESGARVRALAGAPGDTIRELPKEVMAMRGEITDPRAVSELMAGADVAIHMAGQPSVAGSFAQPAEYARTHVVGTATVVEACHRLAVGRLIYLSSAEVYGQPQSSPVSEDHPLQARSPYAAAKIAAERFIESFVTAYAMPAIILRPFSVYGPWPNPESLIGTILRQAERDECVRLASLRPVRDYCYVQDLAAAIVSACAVRNANAGTINIGSGTGASVGEVARLILQVMGRNIPIEEEGARTQRPAPAEIHHLIADTRKARHALSWTPTYSLKRGLQETIEKMRRR